MNKHFKEPRAIQKELPGFSGNAISKYRGVSEEITKRPHIFIALVQNALTIAQSLRDNYFINTAKVVSRIRDDLTAKDISTTQEMIFNINCIDKSIGWEELRGEEVAFIDGGIGSVEIMGQVPMLLRVGTYKVKTGEVILREREQFGFYPIILGDLAGGSKERKDYPDIVRIIGELLAVINTLQRYPNLDMLILHGPLVYLIGQYAGHIPFTNEDIDIFLKNYSLEQNLKEEFREQANTIYPQMTQQWRSSWIGQLEGHYEPICFMRFLLWKIKNIIENKSRPKNTLLCGVTERSTLSEFIRRIVFQRLLQKDTDFFNNIFGRNDINSANTAVERLGYNDSLLLSMILNPSEYSEPFNIDKYSNFRAAQIADIQVDFRDFRAGGQYPFPNISGFYLQVSDNTFPIRVEIFGDYNNSQIREVAQRVNLYSTLLPGYAFPIGLDIVDKYAKVPNWLTDAYSKLIKYHLQSQLFQGNISDEELRRVLVQALYATQRDWFLRPSS